MQLQRHHIIGGAIAIIVAIAFFLWFLRFA
jgi:hypothetical protein